MKGKRRSIPISFSKFEKINDVTSKAKAYIMYKDENRNGSAMDINSIENALSGLFGLPVVGEFKEEKEDFGSHGGKIELSDDGIKYIVTTKPYGFVDRDPELANVAWETKLDNDGVERDYLVVDTYLWTKMYPELEVTFTQGSNQSMEIEVNDGYMRDDGIFQITDFSFDKLCLLGLEVEPCFEGSSVIGYSLNKEDFKSEFSNMMTEIKQSFNKGGEEVDKKGEETVVKSTDEIKADIDNVTTDMASEEVANNKENITTEEVVVADEFVAEETEEFVEEVKEEEVVVKEEVVVNDDKFVKSFELSVGEIRTKLIQEIDGVGFDCYISEYDMFDTYCYFEDWYTGKFYKQSFQIEDDMVILGDREEVFSMKLTEDEKSDLEAMRTEFSRLQEFENSIKSTELNLEKDELFGRFEEDLSEVEDFVKLKENKSDFTIEELEGKLAIMYTRKNKNFSMKSKKVGIVSIGNTDIKNDFKDSPYGTLFTNK